MLVMGCKLSKIDEVYYRISLMGKHHNLNDIDINTIYENDESILSHAVQQIDEYYDNYDTIIFILERGAKINQKIESFDYGSVLHYAAKYNRTKLTILLLEYGADIDMKNNDGLTPLMLAAKYGNVSIVRILLMNNAQINIRHSWYGTVLMIAINRSRKDIIDLILEYDPNCNLGSNWTTPLILAIKRRSLGLVIKLLDKGAKHDLMDSDCITPLLHAIKEVYSPIVEELLRYDCDNSIQLAIEIANKFNYERILKLLKNYKEKNIAFR